MGERRKRAGDWDPDSLPIPGPDPAESPPVPPAPADSRPAAAGGGGAPVPAQHGTHDQTMPPTGGEGSLSVPPTPNSQQIQDSNPPELQNPVRIESVQPVQDDQGGVQASISRENPEKNVSVEGGGSSDAGNGVIRLPSTSEISPISAPKGRMKPSRMAGRVLGADSCRAARELAARMYNVDPTGPTLEWWEWYLAELHARARKMTREGVIALKMIGDLACVELRATRALPAVGSIPGLGPGSAMEIRARQTVTLSILGNGGARDAAARLARELARPMGLAPDQDRPVRDEPEPQSGVG